MKKRQFLSATALAAGALPALAAAPRHAAPRGPVLLTVTGALSRPNRGPFNAQLDQLMHKHKLDFSQAHAFDFAMLAALPSTQIHPTLEYDGKVHSLRGPQLGEVLRAAGAKAGEASKILLRALDGYAAVVTPLQAQRFIVATHLDGQPMALGGVGPLWAICDADRIAELAARPLKERFGACPWGLYHIEVQG
jgi:hypothetical protein